MIAKCVAFCYWKFRKKFTGRRSRRRGYASPEEHLDLGYAKLDQGGIVALYM
jgi:hypothetical protein